MIYHLAFQNKYEISKHKDNRIYYYMGKERKDGKLVPSYIKEDEFIKGKVPRYFATTNELNKTIDFVMSHKKWDCIYKIKVNKYGNTAK